MGWFSGKVYDEAAGRESRSAFIAQAAFWICAARFITHDVKVKFGAYLVDFGKMDASLLAAFLLPCLSIYFGRRLFPQGLRPPDAALKPPEEQAPGPAG